MKVRFLYFGGCPNAEPTLILLKETLAAEAPGTDLESREIKSDEEAGCYGFLGSPTIQINGLDIEKERREDSPYYGCRIYRTAQGSSGIPAGNPAKRTHPRPDLIPLGPGSGSTVM
jgi:hypothetical protein